MEQRLKCPDLSSQGEAALEWWFVQGYLEGAGFARREFMLSLFRQQRRRDRRDAHMLLLSVLEPETGGCRVRSQVSPELVEHFLEEAPPELEEMGIERSVIDAFVDEIENSGPPPPIRVEAAEASLRAAPFEAKWGDVLLAQAGDCFEIEFALPGDERRCLLKAQPAAPWLAEDDIGGEQGVGTMAYHSCPRLSLVGALDEMPLRGEAWIDHQWGDYGWLKGSRSDLRLLGWDWFGINLSTGTDLIVLVHRDMRSGEAVSGFGVIFEPGNRPRIVREVRIAATRHWLSPATMIAYPVAWTIEIPAIAAKLHFEPAADDQEIPVFGFINAIWEGAGQVAGKIAGQRVEGRARLELHGYGYVHDFKIFQDRWIERIDHGIRDFLPESLSDGTLESYLGPARWAYDRNAHTQMLSVPIWDLLSRGGKHWRPIFGILMLQALGVDPEPYARMVSVIPELVHNASVTIDDIEDASDTRRGEETLHLRYGLPTAINMANTLYFLPLLSLSNHPHLTVGQREAIYRIIVEMFVQAHFGQAQDLYWSQLDPASRAAAWKDERVGDLILQAHAFKTAAAVRATAEIACVVADADPATTRACARFGESWGVAFQIVDDVNNFTKAPEWGKTRGEDVAAGKFSFVIHKALDRLAGADKQRLTEILACETLRRTQAGLNEAIGLIEASGALAACRRYAKQLMDEDWPAFSRALPASRHKMMVRILLTKLIDLPVET
jgi:geranylgeranyl pyrophosphate synthase/predicted secreted hydrolase